MIGVGPSYFDISTRISPYVKGNILVSTRKALERQNMSAAPNQRNVRSVHRLIPNQRGVMFADFKTENHIDIIILCTGYEYDFPFLPQLELSENRQQVYEIWNQMFWVPDNRLAFVGLPKMSAVFTLAEAQSAYIARAFSGRLVLPSPLLMRLQLDETLKDYSGAITREMRNEAIKRFHDFPVGICKPYINQLTDACHAADEEGNPGKKPPFFNDYLSWIQKNNGAIRSAWNDKGVRRHSFCCPETLDFEYPGPGDWVNTRSSAYLAFVFL